MKPRALAVVLVVVLVATATWAADVAVIEDWSTHPVGARGVPNGWKTQNWGSPKYEFAIADNGGHRVLHLRSTGDSSTISRDVKGKVKLKQTPILEWTWKAMTLPKNGNACVKATDDEVLQIYVAWPRFPEAVRSRIIGYIWDTSAPVGTICKSEQTGTVTYVVVRSGTADLGQWLTERRNVREDFRRIYGEDPGDPGAISVSIDSNDTQSTSESYVGPIVFRRQ